MVQLGFFISDLYFSSSVTKICLLMDYLGLKYLKKVFIIIHLKGSTHQCIYLLICDEVYIMSCLCDIIRFSIRGYPLHAGSA
jgi:hypothetical protein